MNGESHGEEEWSVKDQYAEKDGIAAKTWELYMGSLSERFQEYGDWFCGILRQNGVRTVLDVAAGTGIDSILLLENGFDVVSCDLSDPMLKYAMDERWKRRKEEAFDKWEILKANWLTLPADLKNYGQFDAVVCIGNSFAHLPDFEQTQENHRRALRNFEKFVKPGGLLFIDHRNYDAILKTGKLPQGKNVYCKGACMKKIRTSIVYVDGIPNWVHQDYTIDMMTAMDEMKERGSDWAKIHNASEDESAYMKEQERYCKYRLSYFPHRLTLFKELLQEAFGPECKHTIYGDFKPLGEVENPGYYIHVLKKSLKA